MLHKWKAYCRLIRLDKPIGSLLLLWPTLSALWLAQKGVPEIKILLVFVLGVFLMRSAGCVINDYVDRYIDGHVKRTAVRPLVSGAVSEKESKILFVLLLLLAFTLVLTLNLMTIGLSLVALVLAWIYPFMKRITQLPQLVLGMAFSWSIPMAFAAVNSSLPWVCWLLLLVNVCWTVAYDTQYAMVDRDDDLKINVKSTAILFGRYSQLIIGLLQLITLLLMMTLGYVMQFGNLYYGAILVAALLFIYQQKIMWKSESDLYLCAFLNNNYVGLSLFLGIFFSY